MTDHDMSPAEYRARWRLPSEYPMVAPDYAETRRELAKKIGLGRKRGRQAVPKTQAEAPKTSAASSKRQSAASKSEAAASNTRPA